MQVLRRLTPVAHPDLLVGTDLGDDAAVWRLDEDRALVATVDFITPVVDDARTWGRIAGANAVSDVYAMAGRPLFALNLASWNHEALTNDLLVEVLEGAADVARQAGFVVVGGHTIEDREPKFGLAVIGEVHPDRFLTNAGLRVGQALVLTKALGTGIVATAIKAGAAPQEAVDAAVASMLTLNAEAAGAAVEAQATAMTDVTGFGLLGHLRRMLDASGAAASVDPAAVPVMPGAADLLAAGFVPGGTRRNLSWASERLDPGGEDEAVQILLADAQTSGGLLFGAAPEAAARAVEALRDGGHRAAVIGSVIDGAAGHIRLHRGSVNTANTGTR